MANILLRYTTFIWLYKSSFNMISDLKLFFPRKQVQGSMTLKKNYISIHPFIYVFIFIAWKSGPASRPAKVIFFFPWNCRKACDGIFSTDSVTLSNTSSICSLKVKKLINVFFLHNLLLVND